MATHFSPGGHTPHDDDDVKSESAGTTASSGTKRKRGADVKFYAVRVGHQPGIYHSWADCLAQVKGYKNATFKSFPTLTEAENFINSTDTGSKGKWFYAVQNGRVPGVYTDWSSAQAQITGWTKPKHKRFATRSEAEAFVAAGGQENGDISHSASAAEPAPTNTETESEVATPTTEASMSPAKKQKKAAANGTTIAVTELPSSVTAEVLNDPGNDLLPEDAEDGFDRRIILNPETGQVDYKTPEQMNATKLVPTGENKGQWLKIYTDGSSLGNGTAGAVAGIGVYFGPGDNRNLSEPLAGTRQTNQRAELTAIMRALDLSPYHMNVHIYSDSYYSIRCCTEWFPNWRRNGWMTSARKPVENKDLIEKIVDKIESRQRAGVQTKFEWVKGHNNQPGNVAADQLAVAGANGARNGAVAA